MCFMAGNIAAVAGGGGDGQVAGAGQGDEEGRGPAGAEDEEGVLLHGVLEDGGGGG